MRARSKRRLIRLRLAVVAFLGLACGSSYAQQPTVGDIIAEVRVARVGSPPKVLMVLLQNRGATINTAFTDSEGKVGFHSLSAGAYDLVIQDDDYYPASERVALNPAISQVGYVMITLNPKPSNADVPTSRVAGSNPGIVDLSEYTRNFPKKAVKEYEKGLQANADKNAETAIRHFQKSIELAPDFYPAHNELGLAYMAKSDFPSAQKQFEEVVRLSQSDAEGSLNLANVFLLTKRYDEALKCVQEGLRRQPTSAVGEFILGSIYQRTGLLPEAERSLRRALELDPQMEKVHLQLVNVYLAQNNKPQAVAELQAFLKAFPASPLAPKAKEVLAKLEK